MLSVQIDSQQQLFRDEAKVLDEDGFLSIESIQQIKQVRRELRANHESLETITGISLESWNNWLYRKRPPSGAALAFLILFLTQPKLVLQTFQSVGKQNDAKVMQ